MPTLNRNNTAVKRIMQEARELANDPCTDYHAAPLEDDIFVSIPHGGACNYVLFCIAGVALHLKRPHRDGV
ncbi:hypothetical protein PISMIDRAFT_140726 [Pisolithus microcarpus 441]|uniref:Uncharacterized protein n=1 Tax=Pisolithus microcarpus 441 TaxID=765257 RepID=A0A0C9ZZB8_9AGAM|nr:hypothetical protein PISMIDRAFT_140726 [Pisolithus microcarpus 441]